MCSWTRTWRSWGRTWGTVEHLQVSCCPIPVRWPAEVKACVNHKITWYTWGCCSLPPSKSCTKCLTYSTLMGKILGREFWKTYISLVKLTYYKATTVYPLSAWSLSTLFNRTWYRNSKVISPPYRPQLSHVQQNRYWPLAPQKCMKPFCYFWVMLILLNKSQFWYPVTLRYKV